ncbi:26S proteasome regulatory subunit S5A, multiubiquitin chain binding protein [Sclerotinia borealis F-4128]|uniref:26S proteasome regulatory subunit S5A, multiubiquitin chain binding protein n=1 Tax=Sclerotinia borealis (strain F-4128) TaxID=1432307 RepID=W9C3P0_SCLBF|nr:26S proteasome regulatory subunit S5A, multiubiquitin chain binding protein [Sclerotinia borealis F-4128]
MVLEAVMIVVDNSESSRNGDYTPTRYEAQSDAASLIFSAITQANPESSVGLMSMGGKGPEVLVTLTTDHGKILDGLHRTKTKIRGDSHLATGIQIAGLALKHRQNKSQRQRIIVFNCSPVAEDEESLVKLAKKMKKNNVSIDFVVFGELDDDVTQKLTVFNENVKGGDGSHLAIFPPGPGLLSDRLLVSRILSADEVAGGGAGGGGAEAGGDSGSFEFGIDPSVDPELALALRMSMEDEKARVEKNEKIRLDKEAAEQSALGEIKEEDEASAPLLNKDGEASGSGDKKDDDKMDTA